MLHHCLIVLVYYVQVLIVLGHNIAGDDVTVLARAGGRYVDAQVCFVTTVVSRTGLCLHSSASL